MQVRLQSKTGPLIPAGDDLLRSLREQTEALQSQWRGPLGLDPPEVPRFEVENHHHLPRPPHQRTASLLAQPTTPHDPAGPGKRGGPPPPGAPDAPPPRAR